MTAPIKILPLITELSGSLERRPGGHNWPDMEAVIDPTQSEIEDDELYLVALRHRDPVFKRLRKYSEGSVWVHPAVATIHDTGTTNLFGKKVPVTGIEFSDVFYLHGLTVIGKLVGIWGGAA